MPPVRVLAIDGGGIRGLVPALVLDALERRTGRRTAELFDFVAGTSTGGILALGVTTPGPAGTSRHSASDLVRFYRDRGPSIFARTCWDSLTNPLSLLGPKFRAAALEAALKDAFADAMLSETLVPVLVPAYETTIQSPFFFRTESARRPPRAERYDFPLWQVARATSAAPTYFPPMCLPRDGTTGAQGCWSLVDGGVFANNPALCAWTDVQKHSRDIAVVSLGTGELSQPIAHDDARRWGLVGWARPILDVVFDGVSDTVSYQLQQLLPRDRHHRLQLQLAPGTERIDDARTTNLDWLEEQTADLLRRRDRDLDGIAELLTATRA